MVQSANVRNMCTVHRTGNWKAWKRVVFFIHRQYGNNWSTLGWRHLESLYMSPFYSKSLSCSLVLNLWVTESLMSLFHSRLLSVCFSCLLLPFFLIYCVTFESWPPNPGEWLRFNTSSGPCRRGSITRHHPRGWMRSGAVSQPPLSTIQLRLTSILP